MHAHLSWEVYSFAAKARLSEEFVLILARL